MDNRDIFKIIFGKNVTDEELWSAGFGEYTDNFLTKVEVASGNISQYGNYKQQIINEKLLSKINRIKCVDLPENQYDQIKAIMRIIANAVISLNDCVMVENVTDTTMQFLQKLGYRTWKCGNTGWIYLYDAKKVDSDTEYLTAEIAESLSNYINSKVLYSFLIKKKKTKNYVIIPAVDIPIQRSWGIEDTQAVKNAAIKTLRELSLEFDVETLVSLDHKPLVFINLRHDITQMQKKSLNLLKKFL